jgi:hypothetical protein
MRGAPLPPLGSFQERLAYEALLREKNERFAMVSLFASLLGAVGGLNNRLVDSLLDEYKEELYQLHYNSKYETVHQRLVAAATKKVNEEVRMLQKVDSLSKNVKLGKSKDH